MTNAERFLSLFTDSRKASSIDVESLARAVAAENAPDSHAVHSCYLHAVDMVRTGAYASDRMAFAFARNVLGAHKGIDVISGKPLAA